MNDSTSESDIRLQNVPNFGLYVADAPVEQVARFFGGLEYLHMKDRNFEGITTVLSGEAARIDKMFCQYNVHEYAGGNWVKEHFPIEGLWRIAKIRCQPRYTLIEYGWRQSWPYLNQRVARFLNAKVYWFRSAFAVDPFDVPFRAKTFVPRKGARFEHSFSVVSATALRTVFAFKPTDKYEFWQKGQPEDFENLEYYKRRLVKDRLNRNIICEYMDRLGLDPESIIERRELDDPMLFTDDPAGESVEKYAEALAEVRWVTDGFRPL